MFCFTGMLGAHLNLTRVDYISAANVIDHTTLVIPVTRADRTINKLDPKYVPMGEIDEKNWAAYGYSWLGLAF